MAQLNGTIGGTYTPPLSFVVRKTTENTGNRCTANCTSLPLTFTADPGNNDYYFIATDSTVPPCVVDSRNIEGGISNVNCDVTQPSFDAVLDQPTCKEDGTYNPAVLHLTNIVGATRYKICYNTVTMDCAPCTDSDGTISGSSLDITLTTPSIPTNSGVLIRLYADSTCTVYKEWFGTITTPSCSGTGTPEFEAELIQPYCSSNGGGTVQNASLILKGVLNATRYKVCYNTSTFNCDSTCSVSDGAISGNQATININAPAEGITQNSVVRIYNGAGCLNYQDVLVSIRSPKCSINEVTMMNLDIQVFLNKGVDRAICNNPATYPVEYDIYVTPNTPGMIENGTQVKSGNTSSRTLPTGNDVPNVYLAATFTPFCGGRYPTDCPPAPQSCTANPGNEMQNMFYRFSWNMSYLKAKYPLINTFTFDVYALKTKDLGGVSNANILRPFVNAFLGVSMVNHIHGTNNAFDADRNPYYEGTACSPTFNCPTSQSNSNCKDQYNVFTNKPCTSSQMLDINYVPSIPGHRKIGTVQFDYTTNKVTWTP